MAYALTDIYAFYKTVVNNPVDKKLFKNIVNEFNQSMMNYILDGGHLHLGNGCSYIRIVKVKNRYDGTMINWAATREHKQKTGKDVIIYCTEPWVFKFYWGKKYIFIKDSRYYKFRATRGDKGNKEKLVTLLKADDAATAKFLLQ